MEKIIIYKGIEITESNGYYLFTFNGIKNTNTNLWFAKVMISRYLASIAK